MLDRVYLSLWLRDFNALSLPQYLQIVLGAFPFSRFDPSVTLRVQALSFSEPALLERLYDEGVDFDEVGADAESFLNRDVAYQIECQWELWRKVGEWALRPSPVEIHVYGPEFERDRDDHIRIDAGPETLYLPDASNPLNLRPIQSNVRSLIRLADELAAALPVEKRAVWSDTGENFAERFEEAL